jgi:tRNA-dihydrouridine synthase A
MRAMQPVAPPMIDRKLSVAPMMDYTDRHFRFLLRLLNPTALLYTEMINAQAIVRGDPQRWLAFDPSEHPVALQLGGNDPEMLASAARIGADFGYDEINLNCGCPSDRVKSGRFGACLMAEPARVADCVAAMRSVVPIPITVKCRIGIEPREPGDEYQFLREFISTVASAGCDVFVIHARKAILTGLSPKENREIPPLRYDVAGQLKRDFPCLTFVVNGGIRTVEQARTFLGTYAGVMMGREICDNPYRLAELHKSLCDSTWKPTRESVVVQYVHYMHERLKEGHRLAPMLRHALTLYAGLPRGRSWRRFISERATLASTTPDILIDALRIVREFPVEPTRLEQQLA